MSTDAIECPICNKQFKKNLVEKHVNTCLTGKSENPVTRRINQVITKNPTSFFQCRPGKRKSVEPKTPDKSKKSCIVDLEEEELRSSKKNSIGKTFMETKNNAIHTVSCSVTKITENVIRKSAVAGNSTPLSACLTPFQEQLKKMASKAKSVDEVLESCNDIFDEHAETKKNLNHNKISIGSKPVDEVTKSYDNKEMNNNPKNKFAKRSRAERKFVLGDVPLAEQMRPCCLDDYYGQDAFTTQNVLRDLFHSEKVLSMILWGPPGCGKTSLAHIISMQCKCGKKYRFVNLSATMAGVSDVKEVVKVAKNERKLTQRKTVLFIDEVHRFNKLQQDSFLPHVEDGTIVLIGATTENPSFHLNNALVSRCRVVVFNQLRTESLIMILRVAVKGLQGAEITDSLSTSAYRFTLENGVLKVLADFSNGDARIALNNLEMVLQSKLSTVPKDGGKLHITVQQIKNELKKGNIMYDRNGDEHYDIISALHKSIRGGDVDASLYWLARMLEGGEKPLYIARRLVRIASEDIGLADANALPQAVAAYQACHFIGMPECDVILAQAAVYLAKAPKDIAVYQAYANAKSSVRKWKGAQPRVPMHLRNASTSLMKNLGYGAGYKYTHMCKDNPEQDYFPKELLGTKFYDEAV